MSSSCEACVADLSQDRLTRALRRGPASGRDLEVERLRSAQPAGRPMSDRRAFGRRGTTIATATSALAKTSTAPSNAGSMRSPHTFNQSPAGWRSFDVVRRSLSRGLWRAREGCQRQAQRWCALFSPTPGGMVLHVSGQFHLWLEAGNRRTGSGPAARTRINHCMSSRQLSHAGAKGPWRCTPAGRLTASTN
jgi:hypothetical protein